VPEGVERLGYGFSGQLRIVLNLDDFIRGIRDLIVWFDLRTFVAHHVRAFFVIEVLALLFSESGTIRIKTMFRVFGSDFAEIKGIVVGIRQLQEGDEGEVIGGRASSVAEKRGLSVTQGIIVGNYP